MATALDIAANLTGGSTNEGQGKIWFAAMRAALAEMGDPMGRPGAIQNLSIVCTVAANALTIALKDRAGADPSANSPVSAAFRNVTPASGDFSVLNLAAAQSLVVSSGSTLGTRNGIPFRLWFVAFNDAGTWRLGVINCMTTVASVGSGSDVTMIYPLAAWGIASSVAEGGAGAADSAQTIYTGSTVTGKPFVVLGYATWEAGLGAAGTWSAGPTRIQLFGPGVLLPNQPGGNLVRLDTGTVATGTTLVPLDNTIPQNTEGDQYMAAPAITPSSAANALRIKVRGHLSNSATQQLAMSFYQDAVANALRTAMENNDAATGVVQITIDHLMLAAATTAMTFKMRAGGNNAGTTTFNGQGGSQFYGGAYNSSLEVQELMG